jgi:hypothetical protein
LKKTKTKQNRTDIVEPGIEYKLTLLEGAYSCASYVLDEKAMWPDDLCCTDMKSDEEKKRMEELDAIKPTKRTDEEKDQLSLLRDILPECEPMCLKLKSGKKGISEDGKEIREEIKPCKYYQAPGSTSQAIAGLAWFAGFTGLLCSLYSLKVASKPGKRDVDLTKFFGAFGFLGFILGLLGVALFSPGTRGDAAGLESGFFLQVIGLCGVLGGVITILDAGSQDLLLPALNFQSFNTKISPKV